MTEVPVHHGKLFQWIEHGGYPVLFGLLFSCGLGLPLPEDIPLIASGILIQQGHFNLAIAAICAWCGIIGGDCVLYLLGRKFGADVTKIPFIGRHVNKKRLARVEHWFAHWGVWVVAIGRMFAGIRGCMVVVAGTSRFTFWKFLVADGLAAIVSGGLFMFLGYKFAQNIERLHELVRQIKGGMLAFAVVVAIAIITFVWWRNRSRRNAEKQSEAPDRTGQQSPARPVDLT